MPVAPLAAAFDAQNKAGEVVRYLMKASSTIYKGGLVALDTNGLAVAFADTANYRFVGVAQETVTSGASGSYYVLVQKVGSFLKTWYDDDVAAQADVGIEVYGASDAEVCPLASGSGGTKKVAQDIKVGTIAEFVSTTQVRVRIDNYVK